MNAKERALKNMEFARGCTRNLLKDWPDDKATFQPAPTANHVLWTLGHLATTDEWLHGMITDHKSQLPETYSKLFGYQSQVQPSAKAYPPFVEVKKYFESVREALLKAANAASESDLTKPLGEKGGGFALDGIDALDKSSWHEGWHAGQLSVIRRALGLKPTF